MGCVRQGLNVLIHLKGPALDIDDDAELQKITLKIADFGTAARLENVAAAAGPGPSAGSTAMFGSRVGTPAFMAPEVLRETRYGRRADVWSLGCVMIEMTTGHPPWHELHNPFAVMFRISMTEELPAIPAWLSKTATDFLEKCFQRNFQRRPTARELLELPFLRMVSSPATSHTSAGTSGHGTARLLETDVSLRATRRTASPVPGQPRPS